MKNRFMYSVKMVKTSEYNQLLQLSVFNITL